MLSRRTRFFALIALLTAALVPGAAVYVPTAHACSLAVVESPTQFVPDADLVVIGTATGATNESLFVLKPEAFLKGAGSSEEIRLGPVNLGDPLDSCPLARVAAGDRVLVYVFEVERHRYPKANELYVLKDGRATMAGSESLTEVEVVSKIRALTGQYAVPAANESEGAGINWRQTIIPLGVVMAILLGIGLVLMRVWHRIDPS